MRETKPEFNNSFKPVLQFGTGFCYLYHMKTNRHIPNGQQPLTYVWLPQPRRSRPIRQSRVQYPLPIHTPLFRGGLIASLPDFNIQVNMEITHPEEVENRKLHVVEEVAERKNKM